MSEKRESNNINRYIILRQCILKTLYEIFKEFPYAPVELAQIKEECHTNTKDLNWNIVYLEKCGYIELSKSFSCPPFIASSAVITAKGIDIVEDESEFYKRFSVEYDGEADNG